MIDKIQGIYDGLFPHAEAIAKSGAEHMQMVFVYRPGKEAYTPHAMYLVALDDKHAEAALLRKIVHEAPQMHCVVHVVESWMVFQREGEKEIDLSKPISERPGAIEVVRFVFYIEGRVFIANARVDHKLHTLDKGPLEDVTGNVSGRFIPEPRTL